MVHRPQSVGVGEPAALPHPYPPDHLGVGVVIPDRGQDLIVDAAVVQLEVGTALQNVQGLAELGLPTVADGHLHILDPLVGGGHGLAEQVEGVVEGDVGVGLLEELYIGDGEVGAAAGGHQFHIHRVRVSCQGVDRLVGRDGGQVHGGLAGAVDVQRRIGGPEAGDLLGSEGGGRQGQVLQRRQIPKTGQQAFIAVLAGGQSQLHVGAFRRAAPQGDGVEHLHPGMGLDVLDDRVVAGTAGQVRLFQMGVAVQAGDGVGSDHLGHFRHRGVAGEGGGRVAGHGVIAEHVPDLPIDRGVAPGPGVAPAGAVGGGAVVLEGLIGDPAVGMLGLDLRPVAGGEAHPVAGVDEAQHLQRQVLYRGQVVHPGVAQVQVLQPGAPGQGGDVRQVAAPGQLQKFQLLAVLQGGQVRDRGAGEDRDLQVRHIGAEADVAHLRIVAQVHVLDLGQVLEGAGVGVVHMVHRPQSVGVGEPAALPYPYTPDHFGVRVVVPDRGQDLIVDAAVVQQEIGAVGQQVQGLADLGLSLVADMDLFELHPLRAGVDGLAEELEAVVDRCLGDGLAQGQDLVHGERGSAGLVGQVDLLQLRQEGQLRQQRVHLFGGQAAQVQLGGLGVQLQIARQHGAGDGHVGGGLPQGLDLLSGPAGAGQVQGGQLGQVLQVLQQGVVVIGAFRQPQSGDGRIHPGVAQAYGVDHLHLRVAGLVLQDLGIAGAAGEVRFFQGRVVLQLADRVRGDHHGHFRGRVRLA